MKQGWFTKKFQVLIVISFFLVLGIAATPSHGDDDVFKNLKVIPKNIDGAQMDRLMFQYTRYLGVTCSYCHPDTKPGVFPMRVDFVTDELPEKIIARKMMTMTDKLNKKYFNYTNDYGFESLTKSVISCKTCHLGLPKPNNQFKIID